MIEKKYILLSFLAVAFFRSGAQDNNTILFKVRNPIPEILIEFESKDTAFYTDHNNRFRITVTGKNTLGPVELKGGELRKYENSFIASVTQGTQAVLIIYMRKPSGVVELGKSLSIPIVHLPPPVTYISDVKSDSIIKQQDILSTGKLHARMTRFGTTSYLPVVAFDMLVPRDTIVDTLVSLTNNLTLPMRRHIQSLKPGVPLYFTNIMCMMPSGEIRRLDDATIFVDLSLPYSIGRKEE